MPDAEQSLHLAELLAQCNQCRMARSAVGFIGRMLTVLSPIYCRAGLPTPREIVSGAAAACFLFSGSTMASFATRKMLKLSKTADDLLESLELRPICGTQPDGCRNVQQRLGSTLELAKQRALHAAFPETCIETLLHGSLLHGTGTFAETEDGKTTLDTRSLARSHISRGVRVEPVVTVHVYGRSSRLFTPTSDHTLFTTTTHNREHPPCVCVTHQPRAIGFVLHVFRKCPPSRRRPSSKRLGRR
jgi:hypothetical protein